jgi:hypothetical protein
MNLAATARRIYEKAVSGAAETGTDYLVIPQGDAHRDGAPQDWWVQSNIQTDAVGLLDLYVEVEMIDGNQPMVIGTYVKVGAIDQIENTSGNPEWNYQRIALPAIGSGMRIRVRTLGNATYTGEAWLASSEPFRLEA